MYSIARTGLEGAHMTIVNFGTMPEATKYALDAYVERGQCPGHFVTAVLENNLFEAVNRADEGNLAALVDIVKYVYNKLPSDCWGSREKVERWLSDFTGEINYR